MTRLMQMCRNLNKNWKYRFFQLKIYERVSGRIQRTWRAINWHKWRYEDLPGSVLMGISINFVILSLTVDSSIANTCDNACNVEQISGEKVVTRLLINGKILYFKCVNSCYLVLATIIKCIQILLSDHLVQQFTSSQIKWNVWV